MNGTTTRATNRQIRRAFGEEAVQTINQQGETLQSIVVPRLMTAGKTLGEHANRLDALETTSAQRSVTDRRLAQSIRARLRWLLTGR